MRIAFFVNAIAAEADSYTTTSMALAAISRGHDVCYVTPSDFILRQDDSLLVRAIVVKVGNAKKPEAFIAALHSADVEIETIPIEKIDVLFLRNDPSLDADERPWAAQAGIIFGRLAAERGVLTVNDPEGLARAQNKLYFQSFPEIVRPTTLISKNIEEIRSFIDQQKQGVILKPLQGSGGKNVFKIASNKDANLNQIFEAVSGEGYLIAQAYLPDASTGDIRLFLMNGRPLQRDGTFAAMRRVPAKGEIRSNMHAAGSAATVEITRKILDVAETVRPKLVEDGMFLVGLDIVGDKILEINVFTPGGLPDIAVLTGVDLSLEVVIGLEQKVAIQKNYNGAISNQLLATL
jgi:glutathione synthase